MANQFTNVDDDVAAAVAARKAVLEAYQGRVVAADPDPTNYSPDYTERDGVDSDEDSYAWSTAKSQYVAADAGASAAATQLMVRGRFLDPDGFSYAACNTKLLAGQSTTLYDTGLSAPAAALTIYTDPSVTRDEDLPGNGGYVFPISTAGKVTWDCNIWIMHQTSNPMDVEVGCVCYGGDPNGFSDVPNAVNIVQRFRTVGQAHFGGSTLFDASQLQVAIDPYIHNYEGTQGIGIYWVDWQLWWTPLSGTYTLA